MRGGFCRQHFLAIAKKTTITETVTPTPLPDTVPCTSTHILSINNHSISRPTASVVSQKFACIQRVRKPAGQVVSITCVAVAAII